MEQTSPHEEYYKFLNKKQEFITSVSTLTAYGLIPVIDDSFIAGELLAVPTDLADIDKLQEAFGSIGNPEQRTIELDGNEVIEAPAYSLNLPKTTQGNLYEVTTHDANMLHEVVRETKQNPEAPIAQLIENPGTLNGQQFMDHVDIIFEMIDNAIVHTHENAPIKTDDDDNRKIRLPIESTIIGYDEDNNAISYLAEPPMHRYTVMRGVGFAHENRNEDIDHLKNVLFASKEFIGKEALSVVVGELRTPKSKRIGDTLDIICSSAERTTRQQTSDVETKPAQDENLKRHDYADTSERPNREQDGPTPQQKQNDQTEKLKETLEFNSMT